MKKNYIGELDCLKFFLTCIIMLMHISQQNVQYSKMFFFGGAAVEIFFVISGYLMCCSAARSDCPMDELGKETIEFIWKKFKSFWVPYCVLFLGRFIVWFIMSGQKLLMNKGLRVFGNQVLYFIPNFLLLSKSGILEDEGLTNIAWYVSAMFLVMLVLFPLVRRYGQNFRLIVAPAIAIFVSGYMYLSSGVYKWTEGMLGVTDGSIWRALVGLCVGCMVYDFSRYIKERKLLNRQRAFLSFCDVILMLMLIWIMTVGNLKTSFLVIIVAFFLVSIIASKQNIASDLFDCRLSRILGKISMHVYFLHVLARSIVYSIRKDLPLFTSIICIVALTAVLVAVVMLLEKLLVKGKIVEKNS